MQICFFEDEALSRFHPLTLTRPVDELRCGMFSLREKWLNTLQTEYFSRTERYPVTDYYPQNPEPATEDIIWINSRCLPDEALADKIKSLRIDQVVDFKGIPIAARTAKTPETGTPSFTTFRKKQADAAVLLQGAPDLFRYNGDQIKADLQWVDQKSDPSAKVSTHAILENEDQIYLGAEAKVGPSVVIDASGGPVVIQDGAEVMATSFIQGPAVIGPGSAIKAGTRLYKETSIGPVCKVGGEVSNIIMQGYSNKAHDGYLGNSVIGEWCNLGADTTSSNLKNNYSLIRLRDWQSGQNFDTGLQFCGTIMGDHTKTSINTMLNTGSQFGVSCNIIAGKFPPTFLRSFSWVGVDQVYVYQIDKALETARRIMSRRNVELTADYEHMMRLIFEQRQ